jgi:hypothetical protein
MGRAKTYFEQIPVEVVKKVTKEETSIAILCAICAKPVDLKKCKIDEDGGAVHEDCYFNKLLRPPADGPAHQEST